MSLESKVIRKLRDKQKTLSLAESCTGGLLGSQLTNIPGSSDVFAGALITYTNDIKSKLLKIPQDILKKYGAVSEPVAMMMSKNVRKIFKTDFGVGISGIAGPSGGTKSKPVGLVYISVSTKVETLCLKCLFEGGRLKVKSQATKQALELLLEFLET